MTSTPIGLVWTQELPTQFGHYFVSDGKGDAYYDSIGVSEGTVFSFDHPWEQLTYEAGQGYYFLGPVLIPEPPVSQQPEVILAANQIDGDVSNV